MTDSNGTSNGNGNGYKPPPWLLGITTAIIMLLLGFSGTVAALLYVGMAQRVAAVDAKSEAAMARLEAKIDAETADLDERLQREMRDLDEVHAVSVAGLREYVEQHFLLNRSAIDKAASDMVRLWEQTRRNDEQTTEVRVEIGRQDERLKDVEERTK